MPDRRYMTHASHRQCITRSHLVIRNEGIVKKAGNPSGFFPQFSPRPVSRFSLALIEKTPVLFTRPLLESTPLHLWEITAQEGELAGHFDASGRKDVHVDI